MSIEIFLIRLICIVHNPIQNKVKLLWRVYD